MNLHDLKHGSNNYLDVINLISDSYSSITNIAMFGYGAKTAAVAPSATAMFPLTRKIRNPFVPNDKDAIQATYLDCMD